MDPHLWWDMLDKSDQLKIQPSRTNSKSSQADRAYPNQPDLAMRDCMEKYQMTVAQYSWVVSYFTKPQEFKQVLKCAGETRERGSVVVILLIHRF